MTDIRIYDKSLTLLGVCDSALRVEASESFCEPGAFSLTVPLSDAERFSREGIISVPGIGTGYVIERIRKDGAEDTVTVTGHGVLSLFQRRFLPVRKTIAGPAEMLLLDFVTQWGQEVLSAPLSTTEYGFPEEVKVVAGETPLLTAMKTVCRAAGFGMRLSQTADGFLFSVRRETAGEIRLSRDDGHITGGVHLIDGREYANQVIVEGGDGRRITVSAAGLFDDGIYDAAEPLREIFLKAEEVLPETYETEEEYILALWGRGRELLSRRRPRRTVEVDTAPDTAERMAVGTRYALDDSLFGIAGTAVCRTKTVIMDETGTRFKTELSLGA